MSKNKIRSERVIMEGNPINMSPFIPTPIPVPFISELELKSGQPDLVIVVDKLNEMIRRLNTK